MSSSKTTTLIVNKPKTRPRKNKAATLKPVIQPSARFTAKVPRNGMKNSTQMQEMICSLSDPFCQAAKGTKWPDNLGQISLPAQVRGHQAVVTGATGGALWIINPGTANSIMYQINTSPPWNMSATWAVTPGTDVVTPYMREYRIVSAGIIIRNIAPAMTTSGYIIVNRLASPPTLGATGIVGGNVYGGQTATHPLRAGMEVPAVFHPIGADARMFLAATANTSSPNAGWDCISVEVVGGIASTAVLDIEFVYNIEFTLLSANQGLQQFIPLSAPSNPVVARLADKVTSAMGDLAYDGVKAFGQFTLRKIAQALSVAAPNPLVKGMAQLALTVD